MSLLIGLGFSLATAIIVIFGDYLIKVAADGGQPFVSSPVLAGCALYAVSAAMWFLALHHVTLATAAVAFSMITLLALCAIGAIYFGERLYFRKYAGICFALVAMLLMVRVA